MLPASTTYGYNAINKMEKGRVYQKRNELLIHWST